MFSAETRLRLTRRQVDNRCLVLIVSWITLTRGKWQTRCRPAVRVHTVASTPRVVLLSRQPAGGTTRRSSRSCSEWLPGAFAVRECCASCRCTPAGGVTRRSSCGCTEWLPDAFAVRACRAPCRCTPAGGATRHSSRSCTEWLPDAFAVRACRAPCRCTPAGGATRRSSRGCTEWLPGAFAVRACRVSCRCTAGRTHHCCTASVITVIVELRVTAADDNGDVASQQHIARLTTTTRLQRDYNATTTRLQRDYDATTTRLQHDYSATTI